MKLKLKRPLVVFDLETTGLDIAKSRIIQISYIKVMPDGTEKAADYMVNPECIIPKEVEELTHITNEMVADKPRFKEIAAELARDFEGCDFAGFNSNHFDVPLLVEEFLRAGIDFDFSQVRRIDVQTIFHKMEPRNLAAAYRFYTGRRMEDDFLAHRADEDTKATYEVLKAQLDHYAPGVQPEEDNKVLENNVDFLADFSTQTNFVDFAGRLVWAEAKDSHGNTIMAEDGKPVMIECINFGKYKGRPVVDVLRYDPGYYSWIMNGDFTYDTKRHLTRIHAKAFGR